MIRNQDFLITALLSVPEEQGVKNELETVESESQPEWDQIQTLIE
jgi:hypothetical protein